MIFKPHGCHLIAGEWVAGRRHSPRHLRRVHRMNLRSARLLLWRAPAKRRKMLWTYGYTSREERAQFLEAIADEIEARAAAITEIGTQETGLPAGRLEGERGRTTGQLRLLPPISARVTIWIAALTRPCRTESQRHARKSG